jgi:hypothetical protein
VINFIVDISRPLPAKTKLIATNVSIDLIDLNKFYDEETLNDLVLDLVELRKTVLLFNRSKTDLGNLDKFLGICSEYGLVYKINNGLTYEPPCSLRELLYSDISILFELLDIKCNATVITPSQACIQLTLSSDGRITGKNGEVKADLANDSLVRALTMFTESEVGELTSIENYVGIENDFELCMYGTEFYATEHSNLISEILDYKYAVFDLIKNIDPADYALLPPEVVGALSTSGYVRLDDILNILNGYSDYVVNTQF